MSEQPELNFTKILDNVVVELLLGLQVDGAHRKQWHMEQALEVLAGEQWLARAKAEFQWDEGVQP